MWDWAGQLRESGEYRTGRLRVVCFHIRSIEGGSPRLCRLRIASVGPCCNKHWVVYWRIRDLWGPTNLVASTLTELEDDTRVRWAWPNSLIVIAKGGHSCCLRGSRVSCYQVDTLQGCIDSNLHGTLGYGWGLFAVFKRRSVISPCSYEIYGYL
jgi:hypothetical protein